MAGGAQRSARAQTGTEGGLLAHREDFGGGEGQGVEGVRLGGLNGRRSCARGLGALRCCARNAGDCLHLFWQVGPMSAQLDLQLSTARRASACEHQGGAAPSQLLRRTPAEPPASAAAESLAPAPALRAPRGRLGGRPARPDGMPAAMLPYACVLVLLGGKCHRPPTASLPEVGKEGAHRPCPAGPGDFCKGLRTASVTLCPARSSPGSLGRHLPHLQPPPGRCRRPRHRAKGARTPPRCAPCGACAPNTGSGPLGGISKEIRRVPGPMNTPWQGTRGRSLRPGLQGLV